MARYTGPVVKRQRRFGLLPQLASSVTRGPAQGGAPGGRRPRRKSEFGVRLEEKQKLKFLYGLQEKQFRRLFTQAKKDPKNTGFVFLQLLEMRLDNVVYRLGMAPTTRAARQLVTHGHILVDGQKLDIPSYTLKPGQTVVLADKSINIPVVVETMNAAKAEEMPAWLDRKGHVGVVKSVPGEGDLKVNVDLQLIIEYYSR